MDGETFTTTSGKNISVHRSDNGEIEKIGFPDGPYAFLTENEIYDIYDYVDNDGE